MEHSELRLLPLNADGVPRYDDRTNTVLVPESDFLEYKNIHDRTVTILNCWLDHREKTVDGLLRIADELDKWEYGCNISTIAGSIAGIGGGTAVIGGISLMPPLAIAGIRITFSFAYKVILSYCLKNEVLINCYKGLAIGGVAAASNFGISLLKMHNLKKNVAAAKDMLESDEHLAEIVVSNVTSLERTMTSLLMKHDINVDAHDHNRLNKKTIISGVGIGAVSVAGGGVRLLLRESTSLQSAVARSTVRAVTAIGIAIDVLSIILAMKDIMKGSHSLVAGKLRNAAEELRISQEAITRNYLLEII
ncbi:hypothetical protein DICVIV_02420 [Dictyocaulus viviparus]|uniref:Tat pathway signal sequence domain protein n=1 Tax=Dictyocaulus viviparus TaxID=29172 RepID=A0A0D8YA10_DICVI|nr:hypothetical protein DICVIV_02420 [Dictyocaulus viviparus]